MTTDPHWWLTTYKDRPSVITTQCLHIDNSDTNYVTIILLIEVYINY